MRNDELEEVAQLQEEIAKEKRDKLAKRQKEKEAAQRVIAMNEEDKKKRDKEAAIEKQQAVQMMIELE